MKECLGWIFEVNGYVYLESGIVYSVVFRIFMYIINIGMERGINSWRG